MTRRATTLADLVERVLDVVPDAMVVVDRAARIVGANAAAHELFRHPPGALVGRPLADLVPEARLGRHDAFVADYFARPARRPMGSGLDLVGRRADGSEVPVELELDGEQVVVAAVRDMTQSRLRVRELERADERVRSVMEIARVGTWEVDLGAGTVTCSRELLAILGRSEAPRSAAELLAFVHPDDLPRVRATGVEARERGGPMQVEARVRRADDQWRWLEARGAVERDERGHARIFRGLVTDVTERRTLDEVHEQLRLSDRLVALGLLSATVAHEINNALAALVPNLRTIEEALAGTATTSRDELRDTARDANEAVTRIAAIVADLRLLARTDGGRARAIDLHRVADSSLRLAHPELRHRARVVRCFGEVPPVLGNEPRLGQVFLNLLVNAAQAIPPGAPERHEVRVTTRALIGGVVEIEVSDTGVGMSPDTLAQAFVPFFTTKAHGTGLGLAICARIVHEMGGEIVCASEPGLGTSFRIRLPAAPVDAPRPAALAP